MANYKFQFPSNGKVYPKKRDITWPSRTWEVFQFPSNGKVYPKGRFVIDLNNTSQVSIPFKRESISKDVNRMPINLDQVFVSIPFKRESISKVRRSGNTLCQMRDLVSIPFKRESISKVRTASLHGRLYARVSIPFKRESISKAEPMFPFGQPPSVSIPFKRESISKETPAPRL